MKQTILYDKHIALRAKMAPFGGYLMPIQYSGIIREHTATREAVAIFDTCHMGEFSIEGPAAASDLERILSCPVATIPIGKCRYGFMTNEQGGVRDDQILYRMGEDEFFMVVNASTEEGDAAWVQAHLSAGTAFRNLSAATAKLDIQGPLSPKLLGRLLELPIDNMKYYSWAQNRWRGNELLVSRTGYTGELGFEIYAPHEQGAAIWDACLELGALPAGLGARDTLRLEMGLPLYGHELDEKTNPAESGFTRAIATDKEFIGSRLIGDPGRKKRLLAGIMLDGRRAARSGDIVLDAAGQEIGVVTSGSFSPSLSRAIALAYLKIESSAVGTVVAVGTERGIIQGTVTELPFYKKATGRKDLREFL